MSQVGSGVALAHAAATIWVKRSLIARIASLFDRDLAFGCKQQAMPCSSRGQNTIHHVDAEVGVLDDLLGCADSHEVARLVGGKGFDRGLDDFTRLSSRVT